MPPSRATFQAQRHRRFGRSNPERMRLELWEWIVREGLDPYKLREKFDAGPLPDGEPDWCEGDLGQTRTELPDGRIIGIGGEHEDYYDPDFCIFNHVIVRTPDDGIEIYGYPRDVFPPTDFHTATLVGDHILIIGGLGYIDERQPGITPVFSLDLNTYRIAPYPASGECPGWIFHHSASIDPDGSAITVSGGEVFREGEGPNGEQRIIKRSVEVYRLRLSDGNWERLTDRSDWREFEITPPDSVGSCPMNLYFADLNTLFLPTQLPCEFFPRSFDDEDETGILSRSFRIGQVMVEAKLDHNAVRVLVQGTLLGDTLPRLLDDLRSKLSTFTNDDPWTINEL